MPFYLSTAIYTFTPINKHYTYTSHTTDRHPDSLSHSCFSAVTISEPPTSLASRIELQSKQDGNTSSFRNSSESSQFFTLLTLLALMVRVFPCREMTILSRSGKKFSMVILSATDCRRTDGSRPISL